MKRMRDVTATPSNTEYSTFVCMYSVNTWERTHLAGVEAVTLLEPFTQARNV